MHHPVQSKISEVEIREELKLLLQSKPFQLSQRLIRFLSFTVERALACQQDELKEYTIGVEVYDRGPSFCPSVDSIVRGEARRLRSKLKEYYQGEGANRPILIYYRLGSYVPLFRRIEKHSDSPSKPAPRPLFSTDSLRPVVAVVPFRDLSNNPATQALANGITDELIHSLTKSGAYRVVAASALSLLLSSGVDGRSSGARLGAQILFEGCVKQENSHIRITSSLVDGEGFQLSSHRFETADGRTKQMFALQEKIALNLARHLSQHMKPQSELETCLNFSNLNEIADQYSADAPAN